MSNKLLEILYSLLVSWHKSGHKCYFCDHYCELHETDYIKSQNGSSYFYDCWNCDCEEQFSKTGKKLMQHILLVDDSFEYSVIVDLQKKSVDVGYWKVDGTYVEHILMDLFEVPKDKNKLLEKIQTIITYS